MLPDEQGLNNFSRIHVALSTSAFARRDRHLEFSRRLWYDALRKGDAS